MIQKNILGMLVMAAAGGLACSPPPTSTAEGELLELIRMDRRVTRVPASLFERLGWDLPDGGETVRELAELAPGGAFDPASLETIPAEQLGYRARWHVYRYQFYGLPWDITGLELVPLRGDSELPLLAIVHGGSANWYEFFLDPLNSPGLGQYLALRMPVLLITIPGNYKPAGWTTVPYDQRKPAYLQDRELSDEETAVRNAIFTFSLICRGVEGLIRTVTSGPALILGHSTGGEIQFLLKDRMAEQLQGRSLGWGTGGPARLRRRWDRERGSGPGSYAPLTRLRARSPEGYVNSYIGPLNPVPGGSPLEVARGWFQREERRRPQFKQPLQDIEHRGEIELKDQVEQQIRNLLKDQTYPVDVEQVVADLFATMEVNLQGYRRMISNSGPLDRGHWDSNPEKAREVFLANQFRRRNPDAVIRVVYYETPMTHYGHIERPRNLAGALLASVKWLTE